MNILPGMAIKPIDNLSDLISSTCRVLKVDKGNDKLIITNVEPHRSNRNYYFTAPKQIRLSLVEEEITSKTSPAIVLLKEGIRSRPDVVASDDALNAKYRECPCEAVMMRTERFAIIEALIPDGYTHAVLLDSELRNQMVTEYLLRNGPIQNLNSARKTIFRYVFQYLAEGSTRNALTPYQHTKGGRGITRNCTKKVGKPNAPTQAGKQDREGFIMTEQDKKYCGFANQNFLKKGMTVTQACNHMWAAFYAVSEQNSTGKLTEKLLPQHQRPTLRQFRKWGPIYGGKSSLHTRFNQQQLARLDRPLIGRSNERVHAVGQLAAIDSTTTDVELVALDNRLERIGQAHRILVVDARYGYIAGFYMGIDSPSAQTVNLAMLHASTSKAEWLENLGLSDDINPDDWLAIEFGKYIADNTDARNKAIINQVTDMGGGLMFVPVARSDLNSIVETKHRSLHALVDHKQVGTTRGKRLQRGDIKPDLTARLTIMDAIRDVTRAIHEFNTLPLTNITPTLEMRREIIDRGLTLNRLNLTKMDIEQGKLYTCHIPFEESVAKYGVPIKGTFTASGVKLHRPDKQVKTFIRPVRYVSKDPYILEIFQRAKMDRRSGPHVYEADFFHNPFAMQKIYYRDVYTGITYTLMMVEWDDEYLEYSLHDYLYLDDKDNLRKFDDQEQTQQRIADFDASIESTRRNAEAEYQTALASSPSITKSKISADKRNNRIREKTSHQIPVVANTKLSASPSVQETLTQPIVNTEKPRLNVLSALIKGAV